MRGISLRLKKTKTKKKQRVDQPHGDSRLPTSGVARGVNGFVGSGKTSWPPSSCQPQFQIPSAFVWTSEFSFEASPKVTPDCRKTSEAERLLPLYGHRQHGQGREGKVARLGRSAGSTARAVPQHAQSHVTIWVRGKYVG